MIKKRKGVSPVVATVLLVVLALILAVIIFFWARSFIGEKIEKQGRAVELSCDEVKFKAEAISDTLYIENIGNIPLNGVEIRKKSILGKIVQVETFSKKTITAGETDEVDLDPASIGVGDDIIVVPVLLGESKTQKKSYVCDKDYGVEVRVKQN